MDSDFLHQPQQQMNSGLTRYRSAPSSYFSSFLDGGGDIGGDLDQLLNPRALSPETELVFTRFMCGPQDSASQNLDNAPQNPSGNEFLQSQQQNQQQQQHFQVQTSGGYTSGSQMRYQSQQDGSNLLDSSFRAENSDRLPPIKTGGDGGGGSGLIRHSSSPAGLFSNIDTEGYGVTRGMGSYGAGNSTNAEESSYASRLKNQMDYSPRSPSSSVHLSESRTKILGNEEGFVENRRNDRSFPRGFQIGSWEDNTIDRFLGGMRETDKRKFSSLSESENQSGEVGNRSTTVLAHHLSLPKSSAELSAMEKLFQDSVPCQIRAKRGCATHPRSIAERVRRTKISERMRKLQELVPNMDKQTNTADMLDLAVDYIKDLQKQVQTLTDNCEKCTCSSKQKP